MPNYKEKLAHVLQKSGDNGENADPPPFAVNTMAVMPESPSPSSLKIEGIGDLPLPLSPESMEKLLDAAEAAPFGKGLETVVDETVRKAKQIDASKITLSQTFMDTIENTVKEVAVKLEISDWKIDAHLYKLVSYEKGGFFLPHKDTEKEPGMFATLAVQLPVMGGHKGGVLRLEHLGHTEEYDWSSHVPDTDKNRKEREQAKASIIQQAANACAGLHSRLSRILDDSKKATSAQTSQDHMIKSFLELCPQITSLQESANKAKESANHMSALDIQARSFPCAAFYADCTHELTPVTSGHRVVLLFNLVRTQGPAYRRPQGADVTKIRDSVKEWVKDSHAVPKLIFPLEHEYTEENFSFEGLKGVDRKRVDLLRSCSELCVNMALVHRHVTGTTEPSFGGYGFYHDHDNREMEYIISDKIDIHVWVSQDDTGLNMADHIRIDNNKDEVLFGDPFNEDEDPDDEEYEGYTGNNGPTLEQWYHAAVVICWPKANSIRMAYRDWGISAAVGLTQQYTESQNSNALQELFDCMQDIAPQRESLYKFKSSHESSCCQVFRLVEKFPKLSSRWLQLLLPNAGKHTFATGIASNERAEALFR